MTKDVDVLKSLGLFCLDLEVFANPAILLQTLFLAAAAALGLDSLHLKSKCFLQEKLISIVLSVFIASKCQKLFAPRLVRFVVPHCR